VTAVAMQKANDLLALGEPMLGVTRLRQQVERDPGAREQLEAVEEAILEQCSIRFLGGQLQLREGSPSGDCTGGQWFEVTATTESNSLLLEEEVSQAWLSSPGLCYDGVAADSGVEAVDGDFLAAAIAFVEAAVGSCGGVGEALQATAFAWPPSLDAPELQQFELGKLSAGWIGGWTNYDPTQLQAKLSNYGEDEADAVLLLLRFLMSAWPQVGLLVAGCKLQHSCEPNCSVSIPDQASRVRVSAATDLAAGSVLSVCYLSLCGITTAGMHVDERRAQLQLRWAFHCECIKCTAEEATTAPTPLPEE